MVKQDKYWPRQAAWLLGLPSGAVTGAVKRRGYWVCQAAPLLGLPSGVVTGLAKRRRYWARQAAPLLGPPSGAVTGSAKRRRYWARRVGEGAAAALIGALQYGSGIVFTLLLTVCADGNPRLMVWERAFAGQKGEG